jgi:hypothetical protein
MLYECFEKDIFYNKSFSIKEVNMINSMIVFSISLYLMYAVYICNGEELFSSSQIV